jgi:hypothetical protein
MADNSEEGQGSQRAVVPVMMMKEARKVSEASDANFTLARLSEKTSFVTSTIELNFHDNGNTSSTNMVFASELNFLKKNGVFWDVTPCSSCKNLRFGGT